MIVVTALVIAAMAGLVVGLVRFARHALASGRPVSGLGHAYCADQRRWAERASAVEPEPICGPATSGDDRRLVA